MNNITQMIYLDKYFSYTNFYFLFIYLYFKCYSLKTVCLYNKYYKKNKFF
jgi:hypothetical protein